MPKLVRRNAVKNILCSAPAALGTALVYILFSGGATSLAETQTKPSAAAPARDGNIAVQEELDLARRAGTAAAYDLFLARHPDHPLAQVARQERNSLKEGSLDRP
jgi:hypothetical protein